jgi:DMSO reductase anchor subunit
MPDTVSQRASRYLGFRPPTRDELGAPRSTLERIGVPGADSSSAEIVLGVAFLAVLIFAWVLIVLSDTSIALRIICAVAIGIDLVMVVARVKYLLERRG